MGRAIQVSAGAQRGYFMRPGPAPVRQTDGVADNCVPFLSLLRPNAQAV
jgi:hypothetical protein